MFLTNGQHFENKPQSAGHPRLSPSLERSNSDSRPCQLVDLREATSAPATAWVDGFRPDLEGLRGVAVLLVVACHSGISWCAGGFIGVDIFFVLSGYLITGLLLAEHQATSRIDLPGFFARRARRLLPAALLVFMLTTLTAVALLAPQEVMFTARSAIAAACYISNVFFDRGAADYFAPKADVNPLLHTWSLGVEEQFYLLWPLLILTTNSGRKRIIALCAVTAVSFASAVHASTTAPIFAFYELPTRAWEFSTGGLLAIAPIARPPTAATAIVAGIAGICVILGTAVLAHGGAGFPGWTALLPVAGTLATLYSVARAPGRGVSTVLSAPPLRFLGARSYSWYLWHWPFVVFTGVVLPSITVGGKLIASAAALLAATATYRYIEHPILRRPSLGTRAPMSLGIAASATVVAVAASYALMTYSRQQLARDSQFVEIGAASADTGNIPKVCWSEGRSYAVKVCELGRTDATRSVVLFGDSHAMQWVTPMRIATELEGWRLVTVVRPGCSASNLNPYRLSVAADHCREWHSHAIETIIAIRPAAVLMASYNGWTIRSDDLAAHTITPDEVRIGTQHTLAEFSRAGIPVVVVRDTPLPTYNIPTCLSRHVGDDLAAKKACDFDASVGLNAAAFVAEKSAAQGLENVYFLDMNDLICPGTRCPATLRNLIVYRDENHLTGTFAGSLAPMLRARLFQLPFARPQAQLSKVVKSQ